nr:MAG TPA: hypothetical protein [Caudoviricetes sp.]
MPMTFSDSKSQAVTQLNPAVRSRFFYWLSTGLNSIQVKL